jgi:ribosome-associated toxin RatA of RatAB toxin-antitoxin module
MGLRTTESVLVPALPHDVFPFVAALDEYPAWLPLVHAAELLAADDQRSSPAWSVEIRAQVGPFARSKRLRMERPVHEPNRVVEFARAEIDGRHHARWSLRVELTEADQSQTLVTMHLAYDGALWTAGLLDRVLDDEVRRGRAGLTRLVSGEPTR